MDITSCKTGGEKKRRMKYVRELICRYAIDKHQSVQQVHYTWQCWVAIGKRLRDELRNLQSEGTRQKRSSFLLTGLSKTIQRYATKMKHMLKNSQ